MSEYDKIQDLAFKPKYSEKQLIDKLRLVRSEAKAFKNKMYVSVKDDK